MGISVLSIIEVIFYATIRLFWRMRQSNAVAPSEMASMATDSNQDAPNVSPTDSIRQNSDKSNVNESPATEFPATKSKETIFIGHK